MLITSNLKIEIYSNNFDRERIYRVTSDCLAAAVACGVVTTVL